MTPAEFEDELAALRRELAAARGIAEAALGAAEAARTELQLLRSRPAPTVQVGKALERALVDHLTAAPAQAAAPASEPPAPESAAPAPAEPAPAQPEPERPIPPPAEPPAPGGVSLGSLAELVSDDLSSGTVFSDLSPQTAGAADPGRITPIDLDRVDGVANDEEERRRARLAALEARVQQRNDVDAARRAKLLELAPARDLPDPLAAGYGGYVLAALLIAACIYLDVWPLAFLPPVVLLCAHLWRREHNERLARLARGFAVPLHGRVLRDREEVLAWLNAFWPANVRPHDVWTSHRHIAVASAPDEFPVLLDVQLERALKDGYEYRPRVDFYIATRWPARLPLLRPGSAEMSPAIAELYARLRRAGFTIRVDSEAGLLLHASEGVVERVQRDPTQLTSLHGVVRDAITLARQLGANPALAPTCP